MKRVFIISSGGQTEPMAPVHCANEAEEMQELLAGNYDLLAGEQISPVSPRRWLLVRREMPVPDPISGTGRWSVDFLFVDQDAVPTFVECKRFADTRSRREVVGQVMEYAANGQFYWDHEVFRGSATETASAVGETIEDSLATLLQDEQRAPDLFFQRVEENLKAGSLRIIFFMEEAPSELKSIVEFLNGQLDRTEVLIVEARQFEKDGVRVVAPTLFGYTEQARQAKKASATEASESRRTWNRSSTLAHITASGPSGLAERVKRLLGLVDQHRAQVVDDYGKGQNPSLILRNTNGDSVLYVYATGAIMLPVDPLIRSCGLGNLEALAAGLSDRLQWNGPIAPGKYPSLVKRLQSLSDTEEAALHEFMLAVASGPAR